MSISTSSPLRYSNIYVVFELPFPDEPVVLLQRNGKIT